MEVSQNHFDTELRNGRTLHVNESSLVGHGEGPVGDGGGLVAGHHHLHHPLEAVLKRSRAELHHGVLRPLPLERQHDVEILQHHRQTRPNTSRVVPNRVANSA
jgi:hypothetical protein